MAGKYELEGYIFYDREEFNKAKKEAEAIGYIQSNTDFSNMTLVRKMYDKLVDKGTFQTIVGYTFLKGVQDLLKEEESPGNGKVKGIPVKKIDVKYTEREPASLSDEAKKAQRYQDLYEKEKTKRTSLKVAIFFLVGIIAAMFAVAQLTPYTLFSNYEEKIVNQYEDWQERLETKEAELNEKEEQLKDKK